MKKLLLMLLLSIALSGCSKNEPQNTDEVHLNMDKEKQEKDSTKSKETKKDYYFDGEIAEIKDVKIKITDTKVIQPGEEGNEYGEKPVFAIWYEATNKTDKEIDPITAWIAIFEMIQDNDDNMVNKLEVGSLPDASHLNTQMNIIKKDGTVENSIAYELDDEVTPVTLIATQGVGGDEIGRHEYKLD